MTEVKHTPMMLQYLEIKSQYPDAILFYRLGDFYEMFNEDAIVTSKALELTLTTRNKNAENPIPMCGVPHHAAKDYIKRLIDQGFKVAICEQMEDAKLTKGMVKREVIQVITPGTLIQDDSTIAKEHHFLLAIKKINDVFYLAMTDVATGDLNITQTNDWTQLLNELHAINPIEIIVEDALDSEWVKTLTRQLSAYVSQFNVSDTLKADYIRQWHLEDASTDEEQVLDYLFGYLFSVQKSAMQHIKSGQRYEVAQFMQMNHYAKSQLELTRSLRTQRKKGSLLWLIDHTKTAMGARLLSQWLEKPLLNRRTLETRHHRVDVLMRHYFERVDLQALFVSIYDLERLVTKASLGTANARDLDQLRTSLAQIPQINKILDAINVQHDANIFELVNEMRDLYELIDATLLEDLPISISEGGLIKSGVNAQLDQYKEALTNGQQWLLELQQRERDITGLKTLKIGFNKVFGYYIEMSRLQAAQLHDERYQRKQTLANNERFITEELKELETTILEAQEKTVELEYELFTQLRQSVVAHISELQQLAQDIAALDVLANFATLSEQEGYVRAEISNTAKVFELTQSRHPAIEKLIGTAAFVPNDLTISPDHSFLLLTGPNMSGKSTYMRQVAFCVILNQIGCFVPAKKAKLPLVDKIFTRIGSSDDISSGQSTFMVEMMETNIALQEATANSLLLFDEIGRGTSTFDGMALAEAIIFHIAKRVKAATIFSTHYHELTDLTAKLPMLKNIHVGAKEDKGEVVFLHKILDGPADKSYGIHVAKLAGLPYSLIEQATQVLGELESMGVQLRDGQSSNTFDLFSIADDIAKDAKQELKVAVVDDLMRFDVNQTTPVEALMKIIDWQNKLT